MAKFDVKCNNCNAEYMLFEKPYYKYLDCKNCGELIDLEGFLGKEDFDVKVPTSVFGINIDGLLHEARLLHGYYDKEKGND